MNAEDDYRDGSALRQLRQKVKLMSPPYPDNWVIEMTDDHAEAPGMRLVTILVKDGDDLPMALTMAPDIASAAHEAIALLG